MTLDERSIILEASRNVAHVRNEMVYRGELYDIRILERVINELATVLENDDDRKREEENRNGNS